MYTYLKQLAVREELLTRHIRIFTPELFRRVFGTSREQTKYFMEEQTKQGLFLRLKKGLYTLKTDMPAEEELANALYAPSYLSFEYALAHYGILPEMPYTLTSATTKPTRVFEVATTSFAYNTIKQEAYTGYTLIKRSTAAFLLADPEKALVDYLYFETLGKRPRNDRLLLRTLKHGKVIEYARLYRRKALEERIREIYADQ